MIYPPALKRPLRLFDKEQIEALNKIKRAIQEQEEKNSKLKEDGLLKKFMGIVILQVTQQVAIRANDIHEAEKKIREMKFGTMEFDPDEYEITRIDVCELD